MIPPVRYSVSQRDFNREIGKRLIISLDGVEQQQVVAYDCEAGSIVALKLDDAGRVQADPANRKVALKETRFGKVTVDVKTADGMG
jgi:hypothetical protein